MLTYNTILLVTPVVTPHPHVTSAVTTNTLRRGTELLASNHLCDFVTLVTPPKPSTGQLGRPEEIA